MFLFLYIACVIFLSSNSHRLRRGNTRPWGLQQPSVLVCTCSPPLLSPSAIAFTLLPRAHHSVFHCHCAPLTSLCLSSTSISTQPLSHVSLPRIILPLSANLICAGFEKQAWRLGVHLPASRWLPFAILPPCPRKNTRVLWLQDVATRIAGR